jgi:hypothetical protein
MFINLDPLSLVFHRSVFTGTTGVIVLFFPFEFFRRFETGIHFFSRPHRSRRLTSGVSFFCLRDFGKSGRTEMLYHRKW